MVLRIMVAREAVQTEELREVQTLTPRRLLKLERDGKLPRGCAVRLGRRVLFNVDALAAAFAAGNPGAPGDRRQPHADEPQRAAEA